MRLNRLEIKQNIRANQAAIFSSVNVGAQEAGGFEARAA
jgi:hypothetical protein